MAFRTRKTCVRRSLVKRTRRIRRSTVGVGHEAKDIAVRVDDPGDVAGRAVRVVEVAEHHLAFALQPIERGLVGEEIAFAVTDGHRGLPPPGVAGGEAGLGIDHGQVDGLAVVFQVIVAQQGARQQARFAEHLETVADADRGDTAPGGGLHLRHHRRKRRHRAAAQVVAIGKPAWQDDQVEATRQGRVAVPDHIDLGPGGPLDRHLAVAVAVGARKNNDGGFHRQALMRIRPGRAAGRRLRRAPGRFGGR